MKSNKLLAQLGLVVGLAQVSASNPAPTVDLGYSLHRGTIEISKSGFRYLNFTNVRYAAPPTGENRFQPPAAPDTNRTVQQPGLYSIICPQAQPGWLSLFGQPVGNLTGVPPVLEWDLPALKPGTNEDCLFLDVLVPEEVHEKKNSNTSVLVFLHGGGYVQGSKTAYGPGVGLLEAAEENGQSLIYVSINYRLGLFGWLAGVDISELTPNLGLLDQQFALKWVQKYIHLFGGNPDNVTLMGESAGGGSIMYHITSTDVPSGALFQRAIPQSPFTIDIPPLSQKRTLRKVLDAASVEYLSDLKNISSEKLQKVNGVVVGNAAPYGTFEFGPVSDGSRYPGYPPELLAKGQYNLSIAMMQGHNSNEGAIFASPFVNNQSDYRYYLSGLLPESSPETLSTITDDLYPDDFSGKYGYEDQHGRVTQTLGDALIDCNTFYLDKAFRPNNGSYAYVFSVPPGLHASDLPYTFLDPDEPRSAVNSTLARLMQGYFANFATTGSPNSPRLPPFPTGENLIAQNLNNTNFGPIKDKISVRRCNWWQSGKFRE